MSIRVASKSLTFNGRVRANKHIELADRQTDTPCSVFRSIKASHAFEIGFNGVVHVANCHANLSFLR